MPLLRPLQGYYAILDVKGTSAHPAAIMSHADKLLAADPCCLQLRAKQLGSAALCELGRALRSRCTAKQILLCVNDRFDIALAVDADVVHLGQSDLPLGEVLKLRTRLALGRLQVGISTHDLAQARAAEAAGADYIGFGPIFSTQTKTDADPAVGLAELQQVAHTVRIPVVAIGGITLDNVQAVAKAGASAAAAIAAVDTAADPTWAGRQIARAFSTP